MAEIRPILLQYIVETLLHNLIWIDRSPCLFCWATKHDLFHRIEAFHCRPCFRITLELERIKNRLFAKSLEVHVQQLHLHGWWILIEKITKYIYKCISTTFNLTWLFDTGKMWIYYSQNKDFFVAHTFFFQTHLKNVITQLAHLMLKLLFEVHMEPTLTDYH